MFPLLAKVARAARLLKEARASIKRAEAKIARDELAKKKLVRGYSMGGFNSHTRRNGPKVRMHRRGRR